MNLKSFRLYTIYLALAIFLAALPGLRAQQEPPAKLPPPPPPAAAAPKPLDHGNPEFMKAADEVLQEMSTMLRAPDQGTAEKKPPLETRNPRLSKTRR